MSQLLTSVPSGPFIEQGTSARSASFDIILTPDGAISATSPAWVVAFARKVEQILKLQDGWDGEGSKAPNLNSVIEALEFLFSALSHDTLAPQVVPTSDGGLQLEWHAKGIDLEVTFSPDRRASFLVSTPQSPDIEGSVNEHATFMSSILKVLRST
jgi:hypothetical protein